MLREASSLARNSRSTHPAAMQAVTGSIPVSRTSVDAGKDVRVLVRPGCERKWRSTGCTSAGFLKMSLSRSFCLKRCLSRSVFRLLLRQRHQRHPVGTRDHVLYMRAGSPVPSRGRERRIITTSEGQTRRRPSAQERHQVGADQCAPRNGGSTKPARTRRRAWFSPSLALAQVDDLGLDVEPASASS